MASVSCQRCLMASINCRQCLVPSTGYQRCLVAGYDCSVACGLELRLILGAWLWLVRLDLDDGCARWARLVANVTRWPRLVAGCVWWPHLVAVMLDCRLCFFGCLLLGYALNFGAWLWLVGLDLDGSCLHGWVVSSVRLFVL